MGCLVRDMGNFLYIFVYTFKKNSNLYHYWIIYHTSTSTSYSTSGLKIWVREPFDKMFDDFEFGSNVCIVTSDDFEFSLATGGPTMSYD